jgi:hypothetical protein
MPGSPTASRRSSGPRDAILRCMLVSSASAGLAMLASASCGLVVGDIPPKADGSTSLDDAGGSIESPQEDAIASADADPCDSDGDGHRSAACSGDDCNDHNRDVHPAQDTYFDKPTEDGGASYDYDCSGQPDSDRSSDYGFLDCSMLLGCDESKRGFLQNPPACGEAAPWGQCLKKSELECTPVKVQDVKMRCK